MLLGIFIGVILGSFATVIMLSFCQSGKLRDLQHYADFTTGLYATDQKEKITDDDVKRLQLFRLNGSGAVVI